MIQHFGSDQVSLSEVIAVSMRSQYYTLIEQSLMTLSEQNASRFSSKRSLLSQFSVAGALLICRALTQRLRYGITDYWWE